MIQSRPVNGEKWSSGSFFIPTYRQATYRASPAHEKQCFTWMFYISFSLELQPPPQPRRQHPGRPQQVVRHAATDAVPAGRRERELPTAAAQQGTRFTKWLLLQFLKWSSLRPVYTSQTKLLRPLIYPRSVGSIDPDGYPKKASNFIINFENFFLKRFPKSLFESRSFPPPRTLRPHPTLTWATLVTSSAFCTRQPFSTVESSP